jgi:hypothetical protein
MKAETVVYAKGAESAPRGTHGVGRIRSTPPVEDFQPRARQLTPQVFGGHFCRLSLQAGANYFRSRLPP